MITLTNVEPRGLMKDPWFEEVFLGRVFVDGEIRRSVVARLSEQTLMQIRDIGEDQKSRLIDAVIADAILNIQARAEEGEFEAEYSEDLLVLLYRPEDIDRLAWRSTKPCEFRVGSGRSLVCGAVQPEGGPTTIRQCLDCSVPRLELLCVHAAHIQLIPAGNTGLQRMKSLCGRPEGCLLYTSPSPRDRTRSRMPSSA